MDGKVFFGKQDLVDAIVANTGHSRKHVTEVLECLLATCIDQVARGKTLNLAGLGRLSIQHIRHERTFRAPNGKMCKSNGRLLFKFRPGESLRAAVRKSLNAGAK